MAKAGRPVTNRPERRVITIFVDDAGYELIDAAVAQARALESSSLSRNFWAERNLLKAAREELQKREEEPREN
jgi:hypothetical protein